MKSELEFCYDDGAAIPAVHHSPEQAVLYGRVDSLEDRLKRALTDAELLALASSGSGERLAYTYYPTTASPLGTRKVVIVLRDGGQLRRLSDGSLDEPVTESVATVTKSVANRIRAAVEAVLVEVTKKPDPCGFETALCVWEEMLDRQRVKGPYDLPDDDVLRGAFETYGTASMRLFAVEVAGLVDRAWATLTAEKQDRVTFDWEFVPDFLRSVGWDFSGSDPTLLPVSDVGVAAMAARVTAAAAARRGRL